MSQVFDIVVYLVMFGLPIYLFRGNLFIGGDDSRLFYAYPLEFLQQIASTSWLHFSSIGSYGPNFFLIPMLLILWLAHILIPIKIVVAYLFYSLPILLGYIYFKKFLACLLEVKDVRQNELTLAALLYIFSPILLVNQLSVFLYSAWLIALIPLILYLWLLYQSEGNYKYVIMACGWSMPLALAYFSIPWLLGLVLPLLIAAVAVMVVFKKIQSGIIKRFLIFIGSIALSQAFWLLPFMASFGGGAASQAVGVQTADTFSPTVLATSHGNIFYPLVNLFHRQIAFDFSWDLSHLFTSYYDFVAFFNLSFFGLIVAGIWFGKKYLSDKERLAQLLLLLATLIALFLFTVNIGPLKNIFLSLGAIPGFAMFRNAYDKFALGYIFLYSCSFAFSLIVLGRRLKNHNSLKRILYASVFILIAVNTAPIKQIVVHPLWTTKDTQLTTTLPAEYTDFMKKIKTTVPSSTNILSLPFGTSSYTMIAGEPGKGIYVGRSPVQLFSGVNDFSGSFSFSPNQAEYFAELIKSQNYVQLNSFMQLHNINYILLTKNLPKEVISSYLFDKDVIKAEDEKFIKSVTDKSIAQSSKGNYVLYKTMSRGELIGAPDSILQLDSKLPFDSNLLLGEMNPGTAFISSQKTELSGVRSVYPLSIGSTEILRSGKYRMFMPNNATDKVEYNQNDQNLIIKSGISYDLGGKMQETDPDKTVVNHIGRDSLIKLNYTVYPVTDFTSDLIAAGNAVTVYGQPGKNILPSIPEITKSWSHGDCNIYENIPATIDIVSQTDSIEMTAHARHEACIYNELPVKPETGYLLSFEYKTNVKNLTLNYGGKTHELRATSGTTGNWNKYNFAFIPKSGETKTLYLYSGMNDDTAITAYRKITLVPYTSQADYRGEKFSSQTADISIPVDQTSLSFPVFSKNITEELGNNEKWPQQDCSAIEDGVREPVSFGWDTGEVHLVAHSGHNACLAPTLQVNPNGVYDFSFDYKNETAKQLNVAFGFQDGRYLKTYPLNAKPQEWSHFDEKIILPSNSKQLKIFIYSGTNADTSSSVVYKDFKLSTYPLNYENNFLIEQKKGSGITPPRSINFKHVNTVLSQVHIEGANGKFLMSFMETFHPGWKLYLDPINSSNKNCNIEPESSSNKGHIKECISKYEAFSPLEVSFVSKQPVFDQQHIKANGFANGWVIDPAYIKANYGPEYYKQNADGSLDFNLVVYFQPQSYFYIGLAISGATLIGCLAYLGLAGRRKKKVAPEAFPEVMPETDDLEHKTIVLDQAKPKPKRKSKKKLDLS